MPTGFGVRRASAALTLAHAHLYANTYMSFTIFQADATASKNFVSHPAATHWPARIAGKLPLDGHGRPEYDAPTMSATKNKFFLTRAVSLKGGGEKPNSY
jgi:hypothetical protein